MMLGKTKIYLYNRLEMGFDNSDAKHYGLWSERPDDNGKELYHNFMILNSRDIKRLRSVHDTRVMELPYVPSEEHPHYLLTAIIQQRDSYNYVSFKQKHIWLFKSFKVAKTALVCLSEATRMRSKESSNLADKCVFKDDEFNSQQVELSNEGSLFNPDTLMSFNVSECRPNGGDLSFVQSWR